MTIVKTVLVVLFSGATNLLMLASMAADQAPAAHAPAELAHFSTMIGRWSTSEETLKPDGSGWSVTRSADWDFYWDYDGYGVRDYYVSPPADVAVQDETTRGRGINLRTYNVKEKQWRMTWLTAAGAAPNNFTATSTDEEIVMLSDAPAANGFYSRITFFDMTEETFEWKMERSKDKVAWREVYRIHGTRKGD